MKETVRELRSIIHDHTKKFSSMSEEEFSFRPAPDKWSRKEVLGHLIDSAQNNLRRFIVGQYEETPSKIVYNQDFWVDSNHYHDMKAQDVIVLWALLNGRIAAVLERTGARYSGIHAKRRPVSQLHFR